MNTTDIPVFADNGRRMATVKIINGVPTFQKSIDGSKHFLRVPPAIAIDKFVFDHYGDQFDAIEITDREKNHVWSISRADFDASRMEIDRGHGVQYAVVFAFWSRPGLPARGIHGSGIHAPAPMPPPRRKGKPQSLTPSMFD